MKIFFVMFLALFLALQNNAESGDEIDFYGGRIAAKIYHQQGISKKDFEELIDSIEMGIQTIKLDEKYELDDYVEYLSDHYDIEDFKLLLKDFSDTKPKETQRALEIICSCLS